MSISMVCFMIVRSCIAANMERYGITDEYIAKSLALTMVTYRKRKENPQFLYASRIADFV